MNLKRELLKNGNILCNIVRSESQYIYNRSNNDDPDKYYTQYSRLLNSHDYAMGWTVVGPDIRLYGDHMAHARCYIDTIFKILGPQTIFINDAIKMIIYDNPLNLNIEPVEKALIVKNFIIALVADTGYNKFIKDQPQHWFKFNFDEWGNSEISPPISNPILNLNNDIINKILAIEEKNNTTIDNLNTRLNEVLTKNVWDHQDIRQLISGISNKLNTIHEVTKVVNVVEEKYKNVKCPVCLGENLELADYYILNKCGHILCEVCYDKFKLYDNCPLCRVSIVSFIKIHT